MTECFQENMGKLVSLRIKQLIRPNTWTRRVHPVVQLWTAFTMFVWVCDCLRGLANCYVLCICICVCVSVCPHGCVGPHFLLVLQIPTSLHWTLAVYAGNNSVSRLAAPCPGQSSYNMFGCWGFHCCRLRVDSTTVLHFVHFNLKWIK